MHQKLYFFLVLCYQLKYIEALPIPGPYDVMFTLEAVAIKTNECGTCRQAGKRRLWDPIKPGYKEYA